MKSRLCERLGIAFPLFAFSHCRDVVAAVSKAGGFGVLGVVGHTAESVAIELDWLDAQVDGAPYGVDLIVPNNIDAQEGGLTAEQIEARIPPEHRAHVERILTTHGIDTSGLWAQGVQAGFGDNMREAGAAGVLQEALKRPNMRMVVNALGVPPPFMMRMARERGVLVGALTGAREHALKHAQAGVDVLIAAGGEAGGHCGDVATLVLVPEVLEAVRDYPEMFVLAAGGVVTGRQMAACMAMGADGAWCGSVWLTTQEAETSPVMKEKFLAATSDDTRRSRSLTGKPARMLRTAWTDAWESPGAPPPLPMPLQSMVVADAQRRIHRVAHQGDNGARQLVTYFVGQVVGQMNTVKSSRAIVGEMIEEFIDATERLHGILGSE